MNYKFVASIVQEDDWYVITDMRTGVTTQGRTIEEAQKNLIEALELYFEDDEELRKQLKDRGRTLFSFMELKNV
ncbi:type II toxin-antitoxin system HicB family antitoxin [Candidatus Falkowbacteria bacterium]|nr:type II toxin-antitoxin system HicB family antitoxin [Candidatus Falkowbacteria bacterium]